MKRPEWSGEGGWLLLGGVACVCVLLGCSSDDGETAPRADAGDGEATESEVYPVPDWAVEPAGDHGLDAMKLEDAAALADSIDSHCMLVTQGGAIVGEWYWDGWDETTEQGVFSATKSFTSTLVGIAQERGLLDIDGRASDTIAEWAGTDSADVTIRNLLSNDSGREWSLITDYVSMATTASDKTQFAIDLGQQHPPGTWWEYNNSAIQTLERVLSIAVDGDVAEFAREVLFEPLGMKSAFGHDAAGNTLTYDALNASCRDLARFGTLFLHKGRWAGGVQVVPETWVEQATSPSTSLNTAYGHLWWLNYDGHWVEPTTTTRVEGDGRRFPDIPETVFAALGAQGQLIIIDPTRDLVMTRIGGSPDAMSAVTGGNLADLAGANVMGDLYGAVQAAFVE